MSEALFSAKDLAFAYRLGNQQVPALRGVSLTIPRGGFVGLTGPSGSGKTTLLNLLGLIEPVQRGELLLEGRSLARLDEAEKNRLRRHDLAFIFQTFHLFPVLSAEENVEFFLTRQGVARDVRAKRVRESLEAVGLWEHRAKKPLEMSGGQRQRVAVARAIAKHPKVILADEPTASLDQSTGREIMEILKALNERSGVSIVLCSHDPMAQSFARESLRLRDGQIDGK